MIAIDSARERNLSKLEDELSLVLGHLSEEGVEDIWCNPNGRVLVNRRGAGTDGIGVLSDVQIRRIINSVAAYADAVVNADSPIISAELPFANARFEGLVPPVVDAPTFSIRTAAAAVYTLHDQIKSGTISDKYAMALLKALHDEQNILIVGGTGSGKTTFLNTCLAEIAHLCPQHRLVTIEDIRELRVSSSNYVQMRVSENKSMTHLLRSALRQSPSRIIIGEVRGGEALDMLKAWNTGHPGGLATVHANDAREGLYRMEELAREATAAEQFRRISRTINVVLYIAKDAGAQSRKRVREMMRVKGWENGEYLMEEV